MTKLDAGLITPLPTSDSGSAAAWGSIRINPRSQSCLCLAWSGCPVSPGLVLQFPEGEELLYSLFYSQKHKQTGLISIGGKFPKRLRFGPLAIIVCQSTRQIHKFYFLKSFWGLLKHT